MNLEPTYPQYKLDVFKVYFLLHAAFNSNNVLAKCVVLLCIVAENAFFIQCIFFIL